MTFEEYDQDKHFELINTWLKGWNYQPVPAEYMPHCGYVVGGCVVQLLAFTDCNTVWFDGFFSDPDSDPEVRREAIALAQELCHAKAKALGFTRMFTFVRRQHVLETALKACKDNGVPATSTPGFLIEGQL